MSLTDEELAAIKLRHQRYWDGYAKGDIDRLIAEVESLRDKIPRPQAVKPRTGAPGEKRTRPAPRSREKSQHTAESDL